MLRHTRSAGGGGPARKTATFALLGLLMVGRAVADVAVYQAVVPSQGAGEVERTQGFGEALRIVAVRASGRRDAAANATIKAAAAQPTSYVQQYGTTSDRMLRVGFDARAVEELLQRAGLPVWAQERPVVLVVLPAAAVAAQPDVDAAARDRGLPLAWPRVAIDPAAARTRIASGDTDGLIAAGGAAAGAVLVGTGTDGRLEWLFSHRGEVAQARGSLKQGVDLAADTLAARYAPLSTRGVTRHTVRVSGVADVKSYAGLLTYLQSLSMVQAIAVDELSGDTVTLGLSLRGDLELLRRFASLESRLRPAAAAGEGMQPASDFIYQP
jgi:hypothetical protein